MLIIIEGADGSGKTTLYNKLVEQGVRPVKLPERGADNLYLHYSIISMNSKYDNFVLDRSFITDIAYRLVDSSKPDDISLVQMYDILKNSKIIYCKTDTQFEDSMTRGEDNITDKSTSEAVSKMYDIIFKILTMYSKISILQYNWKVDTFDKVKNFIKGE